MTRFRLASMALALLLGAGQAFADSTCLFSAVTISSAGTINVTCGGSGLSVTLKNAATSATNCSYKDATPLSGIRIDSSGVTAYCPGASVVSDSCSGIPVPPYAIDAGAADSDMGDHRLIAASASERAAGTIRFTAPDSGSRTFNVVSSGAAYPGLSSIDMTVSACPGDFSPSRSACKVPGTNSKGVTITVGTADCALQANKIYYVNVRSVTPGRDVGLHLGVSNP